MDELRSRSASSDAERRSHSGLTSTSQRSLLDSLHADQAAGSAQGSHDPSMPAALPFEARLAAVAGNGSASGPDHAAPDPFAASPQGDLHITGASHDDLAARNGLFSHSMHGDANAAMDDPRSSSAAIPAAGPPAKLGSPDSQDSWGGQHGGRQGQVVPMHRGAVPEPQRERRDTSALAGRRLKRVWRRLHAVGRVLLRCCGQKAVKAGRVAAECCKCITPAS